MEYTKSNIPVEVSLEMGMIATQKKKARASGVIMVIILSEQYSEKLDTRVSTELSVKLM